jgi:hypothetical protein
VGGEGWKYLRIRFEILDFLVGESGENVVLLLTFYLKRIILYMSNTLLARRATRRHFYCDPSIESSIFLSHRWREESRGGDALGVGNVT